MSKSSSGDGRRGNRPPEKYRVRPGEIRNPYGRRGKPSPDPLSGVDELFLMEAQRIVSRDGHEDVSAAKRLVQEEYVAALMGKDPKVRARLLDRLSSLEARVDKELSESVEWVLTCKSQYHEQFYIARRNRSVPPDVAHPDHVDIVDRRLVVTGPIDPEAREKWEHLKASIKIASWLHARCRQNLKLCPTEENHAELKRIEAHRRRLMRCVPKGWNWREDIYCRYSQTEFVQNTIATLERLS